MKGIQLSEKVVLRLLLIGVPPKGGENQKEREKMKHRLFALCAVSALMVSMAAAQTSRSLLVDVPFPFIAGKTLLDAGVYQVEMPSQAAIRIGKAKGRSGVFLMVSGKGQSMANVAPRLIFNKYGESYFLSQIWNLKDRVGLEVPLSRQEKELRARSQTAPQTETVLARR